VDGGGPAGGKVDVFVEDKDFAVEVGFDGDHVSLDWRIADGVRVGDVNDS
jgi:hypothetical protein